jgi:osmotically-inducible protein OsmY
MTKNDWKQLRALVEELDEEAGLTEEAILKMPGVSSVTNHLSVRRSDSVKDLRSKVVEAIEGRAHRIASRIKVERQGGVVTLRGVASSAQYKDLAGRVAACAPGVETVENLIEVDPGT